MGGREGKTQEISRKYVTNFNLERTEKNGLQSWWETWRVQNGSIPWFVDICRGLVAETFTRDLDLLQMGLLTRLLGLPQSLMAEFQGKSGKQKLIVLLPTSGAQKFRKSFPGQNSYNINQIQGWGSNPAVNGRVPHSLCEKRDWWKPSLETIYYTCLKMQRISKSVSICWYNYSESRLPRWLNG